MKENENQIVVYQPDEVMRLEVRLENETVYTVNARLSLLEDKELYLIGASLKDLGKKCFGFTKMDADEIPGIKARV